MIRNPPRVVWACLLVVVIIAPLRAEARDITISCDIIVRPIWDGVPTLQKRLADDPFRDVLEVYRRDLDQLSGAHEKWFTGAHDWLNNNCLPSLAAARAYQSHCSGTLTPSETSACQVELANAWRMNEAVTAEAVRRNDELDDLERRLQSAIGRANDILKPDATEQMFRRLVGRVQGTMSDCQALARLMGALALRDNSDTQQLAKVAGRVLSKGVSGGHLTLVAAPEAGVYVAFHQSGFRAPYLDMDKNSDNQVRHFVGYFIMGMIGAEHGLTSRLLTEIIATHRDHNQPADYKLGLVAANLGAAVAANPAFLQDLERRVRDAACR